MTSGPGAALETLRQSAPGKLSAAQYMTLARDLSGENELSPLSLVFLASYTTTLFDPFLKVEAARYGFDLGVHHGGFGQFEQVMLADDWVPEDDTPVALAVAMRLEDLDPELAYRYYQPGRQDFAALADDVLNRIETTIALYRKKSAGPVVVANFAPPGHRPLSVFEANNPDSLTSAIQRLNLALVERFGGETGVFVWDYAGLVAAHGAASWTDPRLWSLARTAVASANQPAYAAHLLRTLQGVMRPSAKCLVLDLDNTLWGGVIGDDGPGGIVLGDDYPGNAFKQFQRAVLGLRDRGIILAVSSKNDAEVVRDVFENHPEMLIKAGDIACMRVNWEPKSMNLRAIAEELNIGLDSLVFFDDNPVERAEVRSQAPEVNVVEVPTDPVLYADALAAVPAFDMPALTAEDRGRAASYQAQVARKRSQASAGSLQEFLGSLDMQVEIGELDDTSAQRIAQLVAKTNQFNLTTRRHGQADIEAMAAADRGGVYWLRMRDRYGDMGLIALAITVPDGDDLVIDSLILSCRAANRGMEQTLLSYLAGRARDLGFSRLIGEYIETARNHVVAGLYPDMGFESMAGGNDARYALDLGKQDISVPEYVNLTKHND